MNNCRTPRPPYNTRAIFFNIILQMAVVVDSEGPASSVASGDDVITVETLINGTVDAIKLELELLPDVGEVSCSYALLFFSKIGPRCCCLSFNQTAVF